MFNNFNHPEEEDKQESGTEGATDTLRYSSDDEIH